MTLIIVAVVAFIAGGLLGYCSGYGDGREDEYEK